jgi:hypothetical protein
MDLNAIARAHRLTFADLRSGVHLGGWKRNAARKARLDIVRAAEKEGMTQLALVEFTGWAQSTVSSLCVAAKIKLEKSPQAHRIGSKPRRLPVLPGFMIAREGYRAGDGDHPYDECALYESQCLPAAAVQISGEASCRLDCARWEPAPPGARADTFVSLNGAARGLEAVGRGSR